jgi:Putative addiction module component
MQDGLYPKYRQRHISRLFSVTVSRRLASGSDCCLQLAHDLLDSLDDLSESEIEQVWLQEAVRRHDAIVAGEVETIPADEVLAQARAARG